MAIFPPQLLLVPIFHLLASTTLDDARTISESIQNGRLTCVQLMTETLARIDAINPHYNAIVSLADRDVLLQKAAEADAATPNRKGWLHGIPLAIKDLSDVQGFPTTQGGSPAALSDDDHDHDHPTVAAETSDPFVQRLLDAGAIIIGKTNTPESGLGSHTYNALFGMTPNPYNTALSAGGSSGGAAVAVATGMLAVADGSDMMGSLRNPAGWNHLYSLRPTAGGMMDDDNKDTCPRNPLTYPISTVGPLARNVGDLRAMYHTMIGSSATNTCNELQSQQEKWKIAWLGDWELPMEKGVLDLCQSALGQFQHSNPDRVQVADVSEPLYYEGDFWKSWITIRSTVVSHDAIEKYGHEALLGPSSRVREELQWEVKRGLEITSEELECARNTALDFSDKLESAFSEYDVLALPSAQVWPFPKEWKWPRQIDSVNMDTYHRWMQVVAPASLAGLPVVTVPAGFDERGLPMGIQLIGPRGSDEQLLQLAQLYQESMAFHNKPTIDNLMLT